MRKDVYIRTRKTISSEVNDEGECTYFIDGAWSYDGDDWEDVVLIWSDRDLE